MITPRAALSQVLVALFFFSGIASPVFAQSFYVGTTNGQILLVHPDGTSAPFGSVTNPEGMIIDSNGNLLVADSADGVIYRFTPSGTQSVFASGLSGVSDVAMDSIGRIYAADTSNSQIVFYNADGTSLGVYGTGAGSPEALTFDQADSLFVGSTSNNEITLYPPGGGSPSVFANTPSPVTLAFDPDFTHLYEGGSGGGTILMFDRSANSTTYPKTVGTVADMTFDLAGNFYVLDRQSQTIQKFTPDTTQTTFATFSMSSLPSGFVFIPPVRPEVEGSGSIAVSGGQASFRLDVKNGNSGKPKGNFFYDDPAAGLLLSTTKFSSAVIMGTHAQFGGTAGKGKKKFSFTVNVNDYGSSDTFSITTSNGYTANGTLTSGNIQIR